MKPFFIITLFSVLFLVNSLRNRRNKNKSKLSITVRGEFEEIQINGNKIKATPSENNGESFVQEELILFPGDIISIHAKAGYGKKGGITGYLEYIDEFNKITKINTNKEKWICDQTYPGEEKRLGSASEVWIWGPKYESNTNCKIQIPCLDEKPSTSSTEPPQKIVPSPENQVASEIGKQNNPTISRVNPNGPVKSNNTPINRIEKTEISEDKPKIPSDKTSNNLLEPNNKPEIPSDSKEQPSRVPNPKKRQSLHEIKPRKTLPTSISSLKDDPDKAIMEKRMNKMWICDKEYKIAFQEVKKNYISCLTKDNKRCAVFDSIELCKEEIKNPNIRMTPIMCGTHEKDKVPCENARKYIESHKNAKLKK